jgi:oligo-1,6-glucosidase
MKNQFRRDIKMSLPWWKTRTVYQVYPRSFLDTTGDGLGDINGITKGLDSIKELGAGIVWISPLFVSPMADNGYDMADYKAIDPSFGTMADFDAMLVRAKELDLKIVLDIALNHTSIAHPWFQAAVADPSGPFRDYYHWRDAPNNWHSIFGGPAWSQPEGDSQCYLHLFDKTQADLNWANPAVRAAIHDALRFWLDKGVDGFRLDVVTVISKPKGLPDAPDPRPVPLYDMLAGGPDLHEWLREMHSAVFAHYDCLAIGEGPGLNPARSAAIVNPDDPMLDMIYHFELVDGHGNSAKGDWDRVWFKSVFARWDEGIGPTGWNSCVMGNHDLRRLVSRFGDDQNYRDQSAKALAAICVLQRATPFIYQGDELAMADAQFSGLNQLNDVWAKTTYELALVKGYDPDKAFAKAARMTRDHARTPYNWTPDGGFTRGTPWLPQTDTSNGHNLLDQSQNPNSVRSFYTNLISLRTTMPQTWIEGAYQDLLPEDPDIYAFTRGENGLVIINLRGFQTAIPAVMTNFIHARNNKALLSSGEIEGGVMSPWAAYVFS